MASCFDPTCSITPVTDALTGVTTWNVNIDPDGGLDCQSPDGLLVKRFGSTAPVADASIDAACVQLLGITDAGNIYVPKQTKTITLLPNGGAVAIPQVPDSNTSFSTSYTNPTTCDQLVTLRCAQATASFDLNNAPNEMYYRWIVEITSDINNVYGVGTVRKRLTQLAEVITGTLQYQHTVDLEAPVVVAGGATVNYDINIEAVGRQNIDGINFVAQRNILIVEAA